MLAALVFAAVLALGAYGASALSYSPRIAIERINVSGAEHLRPEIVEAFVATRIWDGSPAFFSESNVFLYPKKKIEAALKEFFPRIESAEISRESLLANAITVSVTERKPFARWCFDESACYAMDRGGFIFAPASTALRFETQYAFEGPLDASSTPPIGQLFLPGRFAGALALLERLGQAGFAADGARAENDQDFAVRLSRGFNVRAVFGADVGSIVKDLELVLSSDPLRGREDELEYVDLRFGNRVYYKFKGQADSSRLD